MEKKEICKNIKKAIRKITITSDDVIESLGTGIVINSSGFLLTANHVVSDYLVPSNKIFVSGIKDTRIIEYKPFFFNVSIDMKQKEFLKPIIIDLAILEPLSKIETESFIELSDDIAKEGEDIMMAGFPDDIKPPLNFDQALNFDNQNLKAKKYEIENLFKNSMRLLMVRHGIVGSVQKIKINDNINGATYWIDNAVTYGASGGPVVDSSGKLIGIISEKGVTDGVDSENLVPSGSTMALSHKLITWHLK